VTAAPVHRRHSGCAHEDGTDISDADRAEITALYPRPDFKRSILQAFTEGIAPSRKRFSATLSSCTTPRAAARQCPCELPVMARAGQPDVDPEG